jgi:hypothetical protein
MAIGKIKASRVNRVDADTYVGEDGILFYNFANGVIRLSDGTTPGGVPVPYTVASDTTVGGIKAGPGANISIDGTLTIDTAGLPLSIGNLDFIDTTISTLNPNVDLNLETNGTGNINLIGAVNFYKPNGPISSRRPFFQAKSDGQLIILVPVEDPAGGGIEVVGSATGNIILPGQPGAMLHLTGNPNVATRFYMDGNGEYSAIVGRRWNGNVAAPTQVLTGQDVLRINSTAATNLNGGNVGNVAMAQMRFTALENQTATAQGSSITFTVTPIGSSASARVDVANVTVANGITATKFTTMGNVVANAIVSAEGSGGNIFIDCNMLPVDSGCELGSQSRPWASAWFGPQSVTLLDTTNNPTKTVVIENIAGNITMGTAGFNVKTLNTNVSIFRIESTSGQIFSNANTIISNDTQSSNVASGSLQTAGGLGVAKNAYIGGNTVVTGNITAGNLLVTGAVSGHYTHELRNAGTIADGGTVTLDFVSDDIVVCVWNNGLNVAYSNFIPGRSVRLIAQKGDGSGTDTLNLDGISANHTSTGSTTISAAAGQSYILEFYSTNTTVGGLYVKI